MTKFEPTMCDMLSLKGRSSEERLLIALVLRALVDLADSDTHYASDAYAWITSTNDREFSFLWACDMLGYEVEPFLTRAKAIKAEMQARGNTVGYREKRDVLGFIQ